MGTTLYGNSGNEIYLNSCARDLVGLIHEAAGARCNKKFQERFPTLPPSMPYKGTAEEAKVDAQKIAALPDKQIRKLYEEKDIAKECSHDANRLVEFAREWQEFLEKSEGYGSED